MDARVHRENDAAAGRLSRYTTASSVAPDVKPDATSSNRQSPSTMTSLQRRRVVLPDPVAFRYLEEDPSVQVHERRKILYGYELYLVEQWACSRQSPTLIIVTYTGDTKHSVVVGVLSVPADEKEWSPRLRVYFKAIHQYHARPKETPLGELMITNLSSFPSALTVISVPDGDIKAHRQMFIVNEDLKRLGCSGRSGMTLAEPTPATQAKFLQLFQTSERVPFQKSVLELVKLCQVALNVFGKLDHEYMDGLLCDVTEAAINDWWTEIGSEYFNVEPSDGILGPTTVAALLGTLLGARNRLASYGVAQVPKDVFENDGSTMKRSVGHFQRAQKMEKTRILDALTLLRLHNVTAKAAAGEGGWGVQRAVKSTVAEIGGKRGEIVIGMVGGKDKANIGDVETTDIDRFIGLVSGERAKWLWLGKPKRTPSQHQDIATLGMSNVLFGKDEVADAAASTAGATTSGNRRVQSMPLDEGTDAQKQERTDGSVSAAPAYVQRTRESPPSNAAENLGDKDALRRAVFKSVADKVSDAKSGLGRVRDAVSTGLRGHASRPSKDDAQSGLMSPSIGALAQSAASLSSTGLPSPPMQIGRAFTWKEVPKEYAGAFRMEPGSQTATLVERTSEDRERSRSKEPAILQSKDPSAEVRKEINVSDVSIGGSVADEADLRGPILTSEQESSARLYRRHSIAEQTPSLKPGLNEARWPRRMSFSEAEEAVLSWEDIVPLSDELNADTLLDLNAASRRGEPSAELVLAHTWELASLQDTLAPWVDAKLTTVSSLESLYTRQSTSTQTLFFQLSESYQRARQHSQDLLSEERTHMAEGIRDVEVLAAKLEYEINGLVSMVQDVEDGVAVFEAQVGDVERKAEELKVQLETESWLHWFVRTLTGIGTGPNITRER
jgi:hypothetical protein